MKVKVLVVEDEPLLLVFAVDIVEDAGFEAIEASCAADAIIMLETIPGIRILFTDIDMPGAMNGLVLAGVVRNRWPPIEILIVSGMQMPPVAQLPERAVFFSKPYDARKITETLARMAA
ncbi:response regulator [Rhizobium leguminosarum]|uniref:response regulator n=1 Tax=Rhizobium leguminosarum TaxID=384 RepID=UPI0036D7B49E